LQKRDSNDTHANDGDKIVEAHEASQVAGDRRQKEWLLEHRRLDKEKQMERELHVAEVDVKRREQTMKVIASRNQLLTNKERKEIAFAYHPVQPDVDRYTIRIPLVVFQWICPRNHGSFPRMGHTSALKEVAQKIMDDFELLYRLAFCSKFSFLLESRSYCKSHFCAGGGGGGS